MNSKATAAQPARYRVLCDQFFEKSGAANYGLMAEQFAVVLMQIAAKYLPSGASEKEVRELLGGLRLEEFALAQGCVAGNDAAWTQFLNKYRAVLYQAARFITRDDGLGRELADSLYADLYGMKTCKVDGEAEQRVSKLAFYMGRG